MPESTLSSGNPHFRVEGVGDPAPHQFARPGDDRRADGEGFVAGVAAAELRRVEHHVGHRQQLQEVVVRKRRQELDAIRHVGHRATEPLAEQPRPVGGATFDERELAARVATEDLAELLVERRVELEQRLRTDVEVRIGRESQVGAALRRGRQLRTVVVGREIREPHESFGVVTVASGGLQMLFPKGNSPSSGCRSSRDGPR